MQICERADILVENFRPGVMERFGLGYDAVAERNPRDHLRLDHGLRHDRPVEGPPGVRTGGAGRDRAHQVAGRPRPRRCVPHRSPQPRRRLHVARRGGRRARRALPAGAHGSRPMDRHRDGAGDAVRQRTRPRRTVGRRCRPELGAQLRQRRPTGGDRRQRRRGRDRRAPGGEGQLRDVHRADRATPELADDPTVRHRRRPPGAPRRPPGATSASTPPPCPTPRHWKRSVPGSSWPSAPSDRSRDVCDSDWARERDVVASVDDRGGGRPPHPERTVEVQRRPRRRRQRSASLPRRGQRRGAAGTARACPTHTIDELTDAGILSSTSPR